MIRARLTRALRRFRGRDDASVTVEFAIIVPIFVTFLLSAVEGGMVMTRHVMLERSLDMAVRDLRIGMTQNPSYQQIKAGVCQNMIIMPTCMSDLKLELRPVSRITWNVPSTQTPCVNRSDTVEPASTFVPGGENEMMLIRVCAIYDPLFPTTGLGLSLPKDATGGYQLLAMSAFVNEPRN